MRVLVLGVALLAALSLTEAENQESTSSHVTSQVNDSVDTNPVAKTDNAATAVSNVINDADSSGVKVTLTSTDNPVKKNVTDSAGVKTKSTDNPVKREADGENIKLTCHITGGEKNLDVASKPEFQKRSSLGNHKTDLTMDERNEKNSKKQKPSKNKEEFVKEIRAQFVGFQPAEKTGDEGETPTEDVTDPAAEIRKDEETTANEEDEPVGETTQNKPARKGKGPQHHIYGKRFGYDKIYKESEKAPRNLLPGQAQNCTYQKFFLVDKCPTEYPMDCTTAMVENVDDPCSFYMCAYHLNHETGQAFLDQTLMFCGENQYFDLEKLRCEMLIKAPDGVRDKCKVAQKQREKEIAEIMARESKNAADES